MRGIDETTANHHWAGYAEAMDLVFQACEDLHLTENHIRQLHQTLLRHSTKDDRHRGEYKKLANNVVAIDADGQEIGVVFETATPFDTPREMEELVQWTTKTLAESAMHPLLIVVVLKDKSPGWQPWLVFFLHCLKKQKTNLAVKVQQEKQIADRVPSTLAAQILELFKEHEFLTISQIARFTGANKNTLKVRLRELVDGGHIQRHGKARATRHHLA